MILDELTRDLDIRDTKAFDNAVQLLFDHTKKITNENVYLSKKNESLQHDVGCGCEDCLYCKKYEATHKLTGLSALFPAKV